MSGKHNWIEVWHFPCTVKSQGTFMSNSPHQCCTPGCGNLVPAELETEGLCVLHFLASADRVCSEMRREAAGGDSSATRRAELETYVAASAMKLALIGTGSVRLSDDIKKRVLTTFLTLMILKENLDRLANSFSPRRATRTEVRPISAAAHV